MQSSVASRALLGLSKEFLIRQYFFGSLIGLFFLFSTTNGFQTLHPITIGLMVVLTLLYPYARFVYEWAVDLIIGDNVFFFSGALMIVWILAKLFIALFVWIFAWALAPIGFLILFFSNKDAGEEGQAR